MDQNVYAVNVDNMTKKFDDIVSELIDMSANDPELLEALQYISMKDIGRHMTLSQSIYEILYNHTIQERAAEWLKEKHNECKN